MHVVIPESLRTEILNELYWNHWGIVRMKGLSRRHVWYPGINRDIEDLVQKWDSCQKNANSPPSSVPHPWEDVSHSMDRIHLDYIGPYHNKHILLMKDAYSGWIEGQAVSSADTKTTLKILKKWRSRWGLPKQTVTDNGTEFTPDEFEKFAKSNGIDHVTSPAYHQSSNGAAERAVQTIKNGLEKKGFQSSQMQEIIDDFGWGYRSTPRDNGKTPSEMFLAWNIRTRIDLIKPSFESSTTIIESSTLRKFELKDTVLVKNEHRGKDKWIPGVVIKVLGSRCYIIKIPGRRPVKRHIDQLLRYRENVESEDDTWDIAPNVGGNDSDVDQGSTDRPAESRSNREQMAPWPASYKA